MSLCSVFVFGVAKPPVEAYLRRYSPQIHHSYMNGGSNWHVNPYIKYVSFEPDEGSSVASGVRYDVRQTDELQTARE
jgi:hypothetical protein